MHTRRLITSLIVIPILLVCVFWRHGDWCAALVAWLFFNGARRELYSLMDVVPHPMGSLWHALTSALFFVSLTLHFPAGIASAAFLFPAAGALIGMRFALAGFRNLISVQALAFLYLLLPLGCLVHLRALENGGMYTLYVLLVAIVTDVGAYYGGKAIGRHKLTPVISPNKTWEGSICGTAAAVLAIFAAAWLLEWRFGARFWGDAPHNSPKLFLVTLAVSATGQLGDLFESAIKRDAGRKDSGSALSGHGGFLDMADALLWIGPAMTLFVWIFERPVP